MNVIKSVLKYPILFFEKSVDITSRASRREFFFCFFTIGVIMLIICAPFTAYLKGYLIPVLVALALVVIIPVSSLFVRRMNDLGTTKIKTFILVTLVYLAPIASLLLQSRILPLSVLFTLVTLYVSLKVFIPCFFYNGDSGVNEYGEPSKY